MKITDFFDRTYIINLPYRKDRRRIITHQLKQAGIALTPNKVEIFSAIRPDDAQGFPNIGTRGAFLSHLAVLTLAKQNQLANVLILEDDLILSKFFKENQEQLVERLQQIEWSFVCLGHQEESRSVDAISLCLPSISKDESMAAYLKFGYLPTTEHATPCHFYGVNGAIFDRLISFLEASQQRASGDPQGGPMHLDGAYTLFGALNPDVTILKAFPSLGWQGSMRSDIHDSKWFDQTPGFKQLAQVGRKGKTWLKTWRLNHS